MQVRILQPVTHHNNVISIDPLVENVLSSYADNPEQFKLFCQCLVHCREHLPDVIFAADDTEHIELSWDPKYEHAVIETRALGTIPAVPIGEQTAPAPA